MLISKEGKVFGKLNIIDFFVILIILAVLAYGAYTFLKSKEAKHEIKVSVKLEVTQREPHMYNKLVKDDEVFDNAKNLHFGKLTGFEIKPSKITAENNSKGEFVKIDLPDRQDCILDIDTMARVSNFDLIVNKEPIKIGSRINVRTGNTAFSGFIIGIDFDKAEYGRLVDDARQ